MYRKALMKTAAFLKRNWRSLAYYSCMLVVLCALGYAADVYRQRRTQEVSVIPAAEIVVNKEEAEDVILVFPENANILREYCNQVQWNDALGHWEIHEAMDCSFAENVVLSLSDGTISSVGCDARMGNYVEIQNDKLTVRYGSVKVSEDVKPGKKILAGEAIGTADTSMLREQYMQEHAHIEFILEEKTVNPAALF